MGIVSWNETTAAPPDGRGRRGEQAATRVISTLTAFLGRAGPIHVNLDGLAVDVNCDRHALAGLEVIEPALGHQRPVHSQPFAQSRWPP